MQKRIILLLFAVLSLTVNGLAQSVEEQADRIGLVGFWKMMRMNGKSKGKLFSHDLDGKKFYIFKNDGTCQYATNVGRIAKANWKLKGKELTIQGNDLLNDPEGINYAFTLVMVTPEKLVLKLGGNEEYVYTTFAKSNAKLTPIGIMATATPAETFAQATKLLKSSDAQQVEKGLKQMEELGTAGYVPALYEIAFTYGWYSDSESVRRKRLLGIEIFEDGGSKYLPKKDTWSNVALSAFQRILELKDSTCPRLNADAAYRLACYYEVPNAIFMRNEEKAREYLRIAKQWVETVGDNNLLQRVNNALKLLQ